MKNYIASSILFVALTSISAVHAEENMSDMNMMSDKFDMQMKKADGMAMKMQNEKSDSKKRQYMSSHMGNMMDMMDMMNGMGNMMDNDTQQNMPMSGCPGANGKGMMMGSNNMMGNNQGKGGMMMGGMMQMMGGMMDHDKMMGQRMSMMQDMMEQMLKHMEQIENQ